MERQFETSLRDLKEQLVAMAGLVERSIECATEALTKRDRTKLTQVYEIEEKVNQAHKAVDESCVRLLALHQPLAADLRLIVAIIKMNTDLERMGDQAVNIAHNSERYLQGEALKPLLDLPLMADLSRVMVRSAIDSFIQKNDSMARQVLVQDDEVDELKAKIFKDVVEILKVRGELVEQGLCLILIARNLERIGDHATNIAEDVIFAMTGEDIRHPGNMEPPRNVYKAK